MNSVPERIRLLMEDAEESIAEFRTARNLEPTTFVAADYVQLYHQLKKAAEPGYAFVEWGSGIGTITIMADLLGFDAVGIEIESDLVEMSQELAERHGSKASFIEGTFVPDAYDWSSPHAAAIVSTHMVGEDGYEQVDTTLADYDVVYGYPWPGEDTFFFDIFDQCARPGALLITYHGLDGINTTRKPVPTHE